MAAVTKTSGKASKAKGSTTNSSPVRGLKLTAAQFQAYTSAYTSTARALRTKIAMRAAATRFRSYRLQSANATMAKFRAKNRAVQAAGVAAFATRQSWLQGKEGHQAASLQARIYADFHQHETVLGRLQYARAGEKKYVTAAIMRTVTQAQALDYEKKVFAKVTKSTAKGKGKKYPSSLTTAQKASIQAAGVKAGLAAAAKVPASRKAPGVAIDGPRSRDWLGKPATPNCVPVAVANAMLLHTGYRPSRLMFRRLERECGPRVTIPQALAILRRLLQDADHPAQLRDFERVPAVLGQTGGLVIGYRSRYGPHAALSLPGKRVVSWGVEIPYDGATEEAYCLDWRLA